MADEIDFENGRISSFKCHMTLNRALWHTNVYHSLTSTYTSNFIWIGEFFVDGRTDGRMDRHIEDGFISSIQSRSWPKKSAVYHFNHWLLHFSKHLISKATKATTIWMRSVHTFNTMGFTNVLTQHGTNLTALMTQKWKGLALEN